MSAVLIHCSRVLSDWIDYNGHMGDYAYGIVFSNAVTAYMDRIGIDAHYREKTGATLYTLDSRISYLKECHLEEVITTELSLLDADSKRIHVFMCMRNAQGELLALCEQVLMHVSRPENLPRAEILPINISARVLADLAISNSSDEIVRSLGGIGLRKKSNC